MQNVLGDGIVLGNMKTEMFLHSKKGMFPSLTEEVLRKRGLLEIHFLECIESVSYTRIYFKKIEKIVCQLMVHKHESFRTSLVLMVELSNILNNSFFFKKNFFCLPLFTDGVSLR